MKLKSLILAGVLLAAASIVSAQTLSFERERHKSILSMIKTDLKKSYFDPTFKGIDLEARYKGADEKLDKADSVGKMSGIIAQFLLDFDDSHLFFLPPGRVNKVNYGFDYRMIGEKCFVVQIDKNSDAEKKGLQVGDQVYSIDGFTPSRDDLWKMRYFFSRLRPQPGLDVVVIKPDGNDARYAIEAKVTHGKKVMDLTGTDLNEFIRESEDADRRETRQYTFSDLEGAYIWKMPGFSLEPSKVDDMMAKIKKFPALVIDLRGNGGGRVDMLLRLISNLFTEDVKVCDEKRRKETKEMIAKSRGKDAYTGKIAVLIDSESASASEIFSKVIQTEKRGQIFGDRSAGAVMESSYYGHQLGMDTVVFFGTSITIADLTMKDGKSLEKVGVSPDFLMIPTAKALQERKDPVLAKVLESLGVKVTPEQAGAFFPVTEDSN